MNPIFKLRAPFQPSGDQPEAIKKLVEQRGGVSTLLGVTGSGKTFTVANVSAMFEPKAVPVASPVAAKFVAAVTKPLAFTVVTVNVPTLAFTVARVVVAPDEVISPVRFVASRF